MSDKTITFELIDEYQPMGPVHGKRKTTYTIDMSVVQPTEKNVKAIGAWAESFGHEIVKREVVRDLTNKVYRREAELNTAYCRVEKTLWKLQKTERRLRKLENRKAARQAMHTKGFASYPQFAMEMMCHPVRNAISTRERRSIVELSRQCEPIPLP